jgi:hypothetical protein
MSTLPDGPLPDRPLPDRPLPDGPLHDGPLPDRPLPDGPLHDRPLPDGPLPDGPLHDGPLPDRPLPDHSADDSRYVSDAQRTKRNESRDSDALDAAGQQLALLARRQHGVLSLWQLMDLGFSPREVVSLTKRGHLHRLHRGVYAVGHTKVVKEARLAAALLAVGPDAFLSHRTAAAMHGLRALNLRRIELTVVNRQGRSRDGLVVHRTLHPPAEGDLRLVSGLKVSAVHRVLLELAPTETPKQLDNLITIAVRKRSLNHERLEAALATIARRPGVARLKHAYAAYMPRADRKSDLERDFDRLLSGHPEIPEPLRNHQHGIWELDYYWPEQKVVLELDGRPYHVAVREIERDRFKDAKLLTEGIRTLRVTDQRFEDDPDGAIADLTTILGIRSQRAA